MTDITKLAPAMKAAAINAKELAIIARYSKGRAAEKFYALANPNNILALVEALEKAQAKATQQGNIAGALFDEVTQLRRHADEKAPELRAQLIEADSELEALRQRIAELESRLGSADKLQDSAFRSGLQHGFSLGQTDDQKGYEQSMAAYSPAAGIKWEAE